MSKALTVQEIPFTGERLVTSDQDHIQMIYEHLHRYIWASEQVAGKKVLDIACGEGYGTNLLAQRADQVIGVDAASDVIRHATRKYKRGNLKFLTGNCARIPLEDGSVDAVVSFETIEHIEMQKTFMKEIRRVLRPTGTLIISSPDKGEYTERLGQRNPFHKQELYHENFAELLRGNFKHVGLARQRLVGGSFISADSHDHRHVYGTFRGDFEGGAFTEGVFEGLYSIAVCSDTPLPPLRFGLFENKHESAKMWDAFETATKIRADLAKANEQYRLVEAKRAENELKLAAASQEIEHLQAKLGESERRLAPLAVLVEERGKWGQSLEASLKAAGERIVELQSLVETRDRQYQVLVGTLEEARLRAAELAATVEERGRWVQFQDARVKETERRAVELQQLAADREKQAAHSEENLRNLEVQLAEAQSLTAKLAEDLNAKLQKLSALDAAVFLERQEHALLKADYEESSSQARGLGEALARERHDRSHLADKVARMQNSFSWKFTSALRAIRRSLLDK